ncbi:MAG: ATP-binding protein [Polyangiales bacterium]
MSARLRAFARRVLDFVFRIRTRLLVVNAVVVLVPIAGVEFARLYERQLLEALERDMGNQAVLVSELLRDDLARGLPLDAPAHEALLVRAAERTRTRIRILDTRGDVVADSHRNGPPEGPEPAVPWASSVREMPDAGASSVVHRRRGPRTWPDVPARAEVRAALEGKEWATYTRVREQSPGVLLFLARPVRAEGRVVGAVYVVRSTQPVLVGLYRIRAGLVKVLAVASAITVTVTLLLAFSISRPLGRLAKAARRIAKGERDVSVPVSGSGEIRELGEAFATMTARLEERLRYASDLAADVAHEFKSPLTSIRGAAELLAEGAADDPEARIRFLGNIALDVERLDRLVSRLLELGRIEASSQDPTPVDVVALAERVAERSESPDVRVRVERETPALLVLAREADLETALANLVENAVKFSPEGGEVVLRVSADAQRARLSVEDRGPGIPEENLPRLFERFFTTDAERNGTGLGLAIVRAVARAHGGDVEVRSAPGEGATFTLLLPRPRAARDPS